MLRLVESSSELSVSILYQLSVKQPRQDQSSLSPAVAQGVNLGKISIHPSIPETPTSVQHQQGPSCPLSEIKVLTPRRDLPLGSWGRTQILLGSGLLVLFDRAIAHTSLALDTKSPLKQGRILSFFLSFCAWPIRNGSRASKRQCVTATSGPARDLDPGGTGLNEVVIGASGSQHHAKGQRCSASLRFGRPVYW